MFTRQKFRRDAQKLTLKIAGVHIKDVEPTQFKTGSLGWFGADKIYVKVGDQTVHCQLNFSLTIIRSKETPESETEGPPPPAERRKSV